MLSLFTCLPKLFLNLLSPCHPFKITLIIYTILLKKIMSPSGHSSHLSEFVNAYGMYNRYMFNPTLQEIEKSNIIMFT